MRWWPYRRGPCVVCGRTAERNPRIEAETWDELKAAVEAWMKLPLTHKKCEER